MDVIASVTLCLLMNMGLATAASLPSLKADIVYPQPIVPCENVKNIVNSASVCCMIAQLIVFLHRIYRLTPSIPPGAQKIGIDNITIGE